ncbi:hypothetical protein DRQ53_07585 [bacterium]|nr:MAG: hypothetical protein DRQ53_07585 [bacterium]
MPAELDNGLIVSLYSGSGRDVALAVSTVGAWTLEFDGSNWNTVGDDPLPGSESLAMRAIADPSGAASALCVDGTGKVQVVGADFPSTGAQIWSEGVGNWTTTTAKMPGFLQDVVAVGGEDIAAAGTGETGVATTTGSIHSELKFETVQLPGVQNEASLVDLAVSSGGVYGCGFNDGGDGSPEEPRQIVMRYANDEWTLLDTPCGQDCFGVGLAAIAATPTEVYVGGSRFISEPGRAQESAWLAVYSIEMQEWQEIVLPEADSLGRVSAILVASDGVVYLTGGESSAWIARKEAASEPVVEWSSHDVVLWSLAELDDGQIVAGGVEPGLAAGRPVLFGRGLSLAGF